jgi:(1->4)-alpha-D-glucan 1-alpha-D-glucosylmutase
VDWERGRAALAAALAGDEPTAETAKLHVLLRTLRLRARLPDAFGGPYEPLDAGEAVCAFRRGGDVAVVVPTRAGASKERVTLGAGWVDLLAELPVGLLVRRDAYPTAP